MILSIIKSAFPGLILLLWTLPAFSAEKVNFSYSSLSGPALPLWVAKDTGFFKKHGLDAQLVYIVGGRVVIQAMLAGEVQMAIAGPAAVIRANLAGADLVYVGVASDVVDFVLVTEKAITNIQQLRGKRVGIGQFGGSPDFLSRIVLEKYGLSPDKDVRIVQMLTGQPGRLAALQSKAIEAVVIQPPVSLQAKQMGFNLLVDYSAVLPPFVASGFVTTRSFIQQKAAVVENGLRALLDAMRYIYSNGKDTIRIIGRTMKIADNAFLREYYREVLVKQFNKTLYPDVKAFELVLEQERKTNLAAAKARPEDFIDTRFLDKLKKEGY
ncbi:MAG: ABC transporter substrate-binding protein [Deltaproteobacteria bacterium]|nr:ABC transporter substrate-binding protein [Deltaproteobacteria bacterium]